MLEVLEYDGDLPLRRDLLTTSVHSVHMVISYKYFRLVYSRVDGCPTHESMDSHRFLSLFASRRVRQLMDSQADQVQRLLYFRMSVRG